MFILFPRGNAPGDFVQLPKNSCQMIRQEFRFYSIWRLERMFSAMTISSLEKKVVK